MAMSPLQLGLIGAGIALVVGVMIFNWWQERRVRQRIDAAFRPSAAPAAAPPETGERVEPSLRGDAGDDDGARSDMAAPAAAMASDSPSMTPPAGMADDGPGWRPPMDVIASGPVESPPPGHTGFPRTSPEAKAGGPGVRQPDPDIECIVTLQPARPVGVGALAAGLHARMGKRLRWFGRTVADGSWQGLASDSRGEFVELAACFLLADRNGAASRGQLDTFVRVLGELAPLLPAAASVPDVAAEADRAEALDRLCADLDVQIGLTVLKGDANGIPGTKLRGVAEAAGFRLASGGRFEWLDEDSGAVLYTLQNVRNEPFTVDTLRVSATNGVVFVLDVPRVPDPIRAFDQMKLAAKRMAHTLAAELVDDNRRPLDDPALGAIRKQVDAAAAALNESGIDPGSPRALALFGA
jgi:ZipA, C-terminal FtsZ-binding domain